jgi:hypothetical protein
MIRRRIEMTRNRSVSWYVVAATFVGMALVGAGCGSDSSGTTDAGAGAGGRGGAAGQAGGSGAGGVGRGGTGGNAGASSGSGGLGGASGAGGRGTGGITIPDGGFNPDGFDFDAFSFDGGGIDASVVPACTASASNGAPCTSGSDTICRPPSGTVCICLRGAWTCG